MESLDSFAGEDNLDARSTDELIDEALSEIIAVAHEEGDEPDAFASLSALMALQARGGQEVFDRAKALCASDEEYERQLGALILGQLGIPRPSVRAASPFYAESVAILLAMLARERDATTLSDIAIALGHRGDPSAIVPLAALRAYPDSEVRFAVAFGLMGFEDDQAINALIALSADEDDAVRDWATFALGAQITADTPAIRAALAARLHDTYGDARGEALVGLARRHDPRVIDPLQAELSELLTIPPDDWGTLPFEAAEESANPQFHDILLRLRSAWNAEVEQQDWRYNALEYAIHATAGENKSDESDEGDERNDGDEAVEET